MITVSELTFHHVLAVHHMCNCDRPRRALRERQITAVWYPPCKRLASMLLLELMSAVCSAEEAPVQAPEEEEAYEEGLLLGFDFGDIEHDLYFSNIKESLSGGNAGNIRYVEFQRVCTTGFLLSHSHFQACRPI